MVPGREPKATELFLILISLRIFTRLKESTLFNEIIVKTPKQFLQIYFDFKFCISISKIFSEKVYAN